MVVRAGHSAPADASMAPQPARRLGSGESEGKPDLHRARPPSCRDATSFVSAHNPQIWINDVRSGMPRLALRSLASLSCVRQVEACDCTVAEIVAGTEPEAMAAN